MKLTHYGHACVLVDLPGPVGSTRVLFDPGTYSQGFEDLRDVDLIMITHAHPDHLDLNRLAALVSANPDAQLVVGEKTLSALDDPAYPNSMRQPQHVVVPGQKLSLHGVEIVVTGESTPASMRHCLRLRISDTCSTAAFSIRAMPSTKSPPRSTCCYFRSVGPG